MLLRRHALAVLAALFARTSPAQQPEKSPPPARLVGCGYLMLYPAPDSSATFRVVNDSRCGSFVLSVTLGAGNKTHTDSTGRVRYGKQMMELVFAARSDRDVVRLPMRLLIAPESIATFSASGVTRPGSYQSRFTDLVDGDPPLATSSFGNEFRTAVQTWLLIQSPSDAVTGGRLQPGTFATTRPVWVGPGVVGKDSAKVPFWIQGLPPSPEIPADLPEFDPAVHLRGVPLVRDERVFPRAFYDGMLVVGFFPNTRRVQQQLVLDRLGATVIAKRPGWKGGPDYIVRLGAAWRDSVKQTGPRRVDDAARFGYLIAESDTVGPRGPSRPLVDTTFIRDHDPSWCKMPDAARHRRLAYVSTAAVSQAELDQVARIAGGTWDKADTSGFLVPLELPGTRAEVSRILAELERLPQVRRTMLSGALNFDCPDDAPGAQPRALLSIQRLTMTLREQPRTPGESAEFHLVLATVEQHPSTGYGLAGTFSQRDNSIEIALDGVAEARGLQGSMMSPGGRGYALRLSNGRHQISVTYKTKRASIQLDVTDSSTQMSTRDSSFVKPDTRLFWRKPHPGFGVGCGNHRVPGACSDFIEWGSRVRGVVPVRYTVPGMNPYFGNQPDTEPALFRYTDSTALGAIRGCLTDLERYLGGMVGVSYSVGTSTGEGINIRSGRSLSDIRYPQQEKPVQVPVCMHAGRTPTVAATLAATRDTWIARGVAPTTNDTAALLLVEALHSRDALVQFATDTILRAAGGRAIVAARLELTDARQDPPPPMQAEVVEVSRMLSDWSNDIPWSDAADAPRPARWAAVPSAQAILGLTRDRVTSFDVTRDVRDFAAGAPNFGWLVSLYEKDWKLARVAFRSREAAQGAPRLVLTLAEATGRERGNVVVPSDSLVPFLPFPVTRRDVLSLATRVTRVAGDSVSMSYAVRTDRDTLRAPGTFVVTAGHGTASPAPARSGVFSVSGAGWLGIVRFVAGRAPIADRVAQGLLGRPDSDGWADLTFGYTVGIVPPPSDSTPAALAERLRGLIAPSCDMGWIANRGLCNVLDRRAQADARSLNVLILQLEAVSRSGAGVVSEPAAALILENARRAQAIIARRRP